jgi:hypothetical protein
MWRVRSWLWKVFLPWSFYRDRFRWELTEALHPEFGWVWREGEQGGRLLRAAELRGWQSCLDAVRGSLVGYPNAGGDIEIMTQVERICRENKVKDSV